MVKILVILPAVSVSICWKRKLQINNQALNHLSSQRWKAHGNELICIWAQLWGRVAHCCTKPGWAGQSWARLAMSAFFLSLILFKTRTILTCFSCALQWHMIYNTNAYAFWQLDLEWTWYWCHPYLFYQPPKSQGQVRKKNALGYGRVIYTQSIFIFV